MIKYKDCDCDEECWEEIVSQKDNHFGFRDVIYFHCCDCGEDFRVEDFHSGEELFFIDFNPAQLFNC